MDQLFLQIINMSMTASYVILFVMVIRLFLKRIPKIYSYTLWIVVLFRLLVPFSFSSVFSMIPMGAKAIPSDIIYAPKPEIQSGITAIDKVVNNSLPAPVAGASVNPIQIWIGLGQFIWLVGILIALIYSVLTTLKLTKKLKLSKHLRDNIYEVNHIETPFVFGLLRPKVYIPYGLSKAEESYIIKHEETHIRRFDPIIKFAFFIATTIHWFNPLVWLAFFLMGKDMELSCDEIVITEMGSEIKKDYSHSLLSLSSSKRMIGGSPLAFGGENTKGRIKNILNYKKPKFWVTSVGGIVIVLAVMGLISNPKEQIRKEPEPGDTLIKQEDKKQEELVEELAEETSYDKISAYMKEASTATFSPYYELLEFNISNYQEEIIDGSVHATFYYQIIEKNYDKDPDTVGYIKDAKENGSSYYQQMYDEYLEPREMNFDLKVVIDENDAITLYSNVSPNGIEWEESKMGDFILPQKVADPKFTEQEIEQAIKIVENDFAFPAASLTKVWYEEKESNKLSKLYLESGRGSVNGTEPGNVIVLLSNFDVDDSGDNPVLNPSSTYENYQWILIRDDQTSDWKIDDWGY